MFYYNGECFLIQCNKTNPDACDPEYRKGEKFENTYLIKVNTNGKSDYILYFFAMIFDLPSIMP